MTVKITGKVWVFGDDINTDLMYPHICYTLPERERPGYTMWANRPGWAGLVSSGDILLAGKNFGAGSSRPAAENLKKLGISIVVAESLNGLFLRNAVNSGLPAVECRGTPGFANEGETISVDLSEGLLHNMTSGAECTFKPLPEFLMEIVEAGGIIEVLKKRGCIDPNPL